MPLWILEAYTHELTFACSSELLYCHSILINPHGLKAPAERVTNQTRLSNGTSKSANGVKKRLLRLWQKDTDRRRAREFYRYYDLPTEGLGPIFIWHMP